MSATRNGEALEALRRLHRHWDAADHGGDDGARCLKCSHLSAEYWSAKGPMPWDEPRPSQEETE